MSSSDVTEPLDLDRIREASDGDSEFMRQLVEVYLDDTAMRLRALQAAVESGDVTAMRKNAHQLKGSSANIGATALCELARQIERLGQSNNVAGAAELVAELRRELARLQQTFAGIIAEQA